jgi:hypothetical protein
MINSVPFAFEGAAVRAEVIAMLRVVLAETLRGSLADCPDAVRDLLEDACGLLDQAEGFERQGCPVAGAAGLPLH